MSELSLVATIEDAPAPMLTPDLYTSRELSWIAFNHRVLREALNTRQPLLERLKYVAIAGSNLDEFLMVRVSGLRHQVHDGVAERRPDGRTPAEELAAIRHAIHPELAEQTRIFTQELLPELAAHGIVLADYRQLAPEQQHALTAYFERMVFPVCTPLGVDPGHPFPRISNLSLNLAVVLDDPDGGRRFARVKVPDVLPRIVTVPPSPEQPGDAPQTLTWLEQVLAAHLDRLFPGMQVVEVHPFRVIRDAEVAIQELEAADLLESMAEGVHRRRFNSVVALMVQPAMSEAVREMLVDNLRLAPEDLWVVDGPLGLSDLMQVYRLDRPDLKDAPFTARPPASLRRTSDIFAAIQQEDILLHHPYDSFAPVVEFIQDAARDPDVLAIKQTLYRCGTDSPIVHALQDAAERGKQVAVFVELKARFDEDNNIGWARRLERAGAHVTYGVQDLKTHCKLALVVRKEASGLRRYVHVGTGNYNAGTARLYTDLGLLTCRPDIAADVSEVFNYITGYSKQRAYRRLLVAPVNLRDGLRDRIEREIAHHQQAGNGHLIFKMNALVDRVLIVALYRASQAGVRVDLLVRGICCLRPGLPGMSENVRVVSVIGRFLEHSRVYYFHNGGTPDVLIGSADLMPRNLDHRVEVLAPFESEPLKTIIHDDILQLYLRDTLQAWELGADGQYWRRAAGDGAPPVEAQATLLARALSDDAATAAPPLPRALY